MSQPVLFKVGRALQTLAIVWLVGLWAVVGYLLLQIPAVSTMAETAINWLYAQLQHLLITIFVLCALIFGWTVGLTVLLHKLGARLMRQGESR